MRSDDQLMMERTEYDEHMDDLASRISASVQGEKCSEVVFACCAVIGFAMSELDRGERCVIHPMVTKFMAEVMERCNEQERLHS
jgi:hypothetical protein